MNSISQRASSVVASPVFGGAIVLASLCVVGTLNTFAAEAASTNSPPLTLWDTTARATVGGGYRANILQSSIAPESSAFASSSVELSLARIAENGSLFSLFVLGEDTRYADAPSVPGEQFFCGSARVLVPVGGQDRVGALAQYIYQHQIVDASETEADLYRVLVQGHSANFRPDWRHSLSPAWYVQLDGLMIRQWYQSQLDNYWEGGGGLTLGHTYGRRSELTLTYQSQHLFFDTRTPTDATGAALLNAGLVYWQQETAGQWRHYWDRARHWQSTVRAGFLASCDNGAGYYDFNRVLLSSRLRWEPDRWQLSAGARLGWYHYPVQTIGDQLRARSYCTLDAASNAASASTA
jgi:hypothetical protein